MRRLCRLTPALIFSLWTCSSKDLPPEYRGLPVPEARLQASDARQRGRALYLQHCALCHGERADGRGVRQNLSSQPRDFTDPSWVDRVTPRRLFYIIREGIQGTGMPAWKALDEDQTWDLVAYLLKIADQGP